VVDDGDHEIDLVGPARRGLAMGLNEAAGYGALALTASATGLIAERWGLRASAVPVGAGVRRARTRAVGDPRPRNQGQSCPIGCPLSQQCVPHLLSLAVCGIDKGRKMPSAKWRQGPCKAILSPIERATVAAVEMDEAAVDW